MFGAFQFGQPYFAEPPSLPVAPALRPSGPSLESWHQWLRKQRKKAAHVAPVVARFTGQTHFVLSGRVKARGIENPSEEELLAVMLLLD